jgi:hypothetical protein
MTNIIREERRSSVRVSREWLQRNSCVTRNYRSENCFGQMLQWEVKRAFYAQYTCSENLLLYEIIKLKRFLCCTMLCCAMLCYAVSFRPFDAFDVILFVRVHHRTSAFMNWSVSGNNTNNASEYRCSLMLPKMLIFYFCIEVTVTVAVQELSSSSQTLGSWV